MQLALVRSIRGMENAHITRPGYAIEYDFFDPRDLQHTLETKPIQGLFFAGQINGTTGYEEAAAQGLLAGINAGLKAQGKPSWYPRRDEAYIGVMIDDLITLGTREPYRMFTSRAEYRLLLREDNADLRLTAKGRELGLVDDARWARFCTKQDGIASESERLRTTYIHPNTPAADSLADRLSSPLLREASLMDLLKRPEFGYADIAALKGAAVQDEQVAEQVEISAKYAGYIDRQQEDIERLQRSEAVAIPAGFDYSAVKGLSHEVTHKLTQAQPATIGQASRVPGVTPAAISLLLINLKKKSTPAAPRDDASLAG